MREFIFTPHERAMILNFLETGTKPYGFRTLQYRIKKNAKRLREDMNLIDLILSQQEELNI